MEQELPVYGTLFFGLIALAVFGCIYVGGMWLYGWRVG
jgi:hypothetical protein